MDKTFCPNGTFAVPRRPADAEKFTESFLCDEIHDNLRTLRLAMPFSDEFTQMFEKGMFTKSNTKAFPHLMKYLLVIIDANEFKKKFRWPIYDKAAEASFRNSTLEFLNRLNAKCSMGLPEIKNKILVFPGGIEFMHMIFEVTKVAINILAKRMGGNDFLSQKYLTMREATKRYDEIEALDAYYDEITKTIDPMKTDIKKRTQNLMELLKNLTANTNITPNDILNDNLNEKWEETQQDVIEFGVKPDMQKIVKFQKECDRFEEKICEIFKQQTVIFDVDNLNSFSMRMQQMFPQYADQMSSLVMNGRINMDNMFLAFQLAAPVILQSIEMFKPISAEALLYESQCLGQLQQKLIELLQQATQSIELNEAGAIESGEGEIRRTEISENIRSLILSTPTISYDAIKRSEKAGLQPKRISLIENANYLRSDSNIMVKPRIGARPLVSILEASMAVGQTSSLSLPNASMTKNKFDPLKLMQSIKKRGRIQPKTNVKAVHRLHFGLMDETRSNDTVLSVPEFSSTLLEHSTDLQNHSFGRLSTASDENGNANDNRIPVLNSPSMNPGMKRSLRSQFGNENDGYSVNRSPSGCIEPLVASERSRPTIASLGQNGVNDNAMEVTALSTPRDKMQSKINEYEDNYVNNNTEISQSATNVVRFNFNRLIDEDNESLANISDGILNGLDALNLSN